jgi:alpha-mannosidase
MGGEQRVIPVSSHYPTRAAGPVGKQIDRIYRDRLGQFTDGGQYYGQGLLPYVAYASSLTSPHPDTT